MTAQAPVIFIHGLWIHSSSWQPWMELYRSAGYDASAPGWPGDAVDVMRTRADPTSVSGRGIDEITAHYATLIDDLPAKPIVIGHSFGGLIAQKLLADGRAVSAVGICPGQIKGVKPVPFAQIRSGLPVLRNPRNRKKAVSLNSKQFRYAFGNAISEAESDELFAKWTIPGPGKPLFEASSANFKKNSPAAVDTRTDARGPLLIIGAGKDHTVPEVVAKAAHRLYAKSNATTDYLAFPDRGHSLVLDRGWRDVAEATLTWLEGHAH